MSFQVLNVITTYWWSCTGGLLILWNVSIVEWPGLLFGYHVLLHINWQIEDYSYSSVWSSTLFYLYGYRNTAVCICPVSQSCKVNLTFLVDIRQNPQLWIKSFTGPNIHLRICILRIAAGNISFVRKNPRWISPLWMYSWKWNGTRQWYLFINIWSGGYYLSGILFSLLPMPPSFRQAAFVNVHWQQRLPWAGHWTWGLYVFIYPSICRCQGKGESYFLCLACRENWG